MKRGDLFVDKIDTLIEELKLNGYEASFDKQHKICIETQGGVNKIRYMSEESLMYNYYRCIRHVGNKLSNFGLENKLKKQKLKNKKVKHGKENKLE